VKIHQLMLTFEGSHKQITTTGFLNWSKFWKFCRKGRLHHRLSGKVIPTCSKLSRSDFGSNMDVSNLRTVLWGHNLNQTHLQNVSISQ